MIEDTEHIERLAVVALLEDLPEHDLRRGQIGAAVDELAPGVFDVKFSDTLGRTISLVPLPAAKLIALHKTVAKAA